MLLSTLVYRHVNWTKSWQKKESLEPLAEIMWIDFVPLSVGGWTNPLSRSRPFITVWSNSARGLYILGRRKEIGTTMTRVYSWIRNESMAESIDNGWINEQFTWTSPSFTTIGVDRLWLMRCYGHTGHDGTAGCQHLAAVTNESANKWDELVDVKERVAREISLWDGLAQVTKRESVVFRGIYRVT